jgi:hypothetical protein
VAGKFYQKGNQMSYPSPYDQLYMGNTSAEDKAELYRRNQEFARVHLLKGRSNAKYHYDWEIAGDHDRLMLTRDKRYVLLTSPYEGNGVITALLKAGMIETDPLYHPWAKTFYLEFDTIKAVKEWCKRLHHIKVMLREEKHSF